MWSCWGLNWTHDSFMCVRQKRAALPKKPTMRTCCCFEKVMESLTCRISWHPLGILWHPFLVYTQFCSLQNLHVRSCNVLVPAADFVSLGWGKLNDIWRFSRWTCWVARVHFWTFYYRQIVGVFKINRLTMKLWSEAMAFMDQIRECRLPGDTVGSCETAFFGAVTGS